MKRDFAVSTAVILGMAVALSAAAADQTYSTWSGGSGKWSDARHWSKGVPNNPNCQVYFETEGADYTVELDTDYVGTYFNVKTPAAGVEKGHTVRLTGSATITASGSGTAWEVQSGASLIWDGPSFVAKEGRSTANNGFFEMRSGSFEQGTVFYSTSATSRFLMSGGYLWAQRFKISEKVTASFTQTGGYFHTPSFEASVVDGVIQNPVSVTGGIFRRDQEVNVYAAETIDWRQATNVVSSIRFRGGATEDSYPKFYGDVLVLKTGMDNFDWAYYMGFPHGITFGAIGDWKYTRRTHDMIYERTYIDTADFFDPTVKRTVYWDYYQFMKPRLDFRIFGGGTFEFPICDNQCLPGMINNFEVGDETTVQMAWASRAASALRSNYLYTERFRLGANARLEIEGAGIHKISCSEEPEFGPGTSLQAYNHSDVSLKAGDRHPILACATKALPTDLPISLTGTVPDGWSLGYCGPCAWMWDGTLPTKDASNAYEWCGGTDGCLSTPENWSKGELPTRLTDSSQNLKFNTVQGVITNDIDNLKLNQISCTTACGPFVFTGKPISIARNGKQRGSAAAVYFQSMGYPVVFDCDVSGPGNPFNVCAGNASTYTSIAFMRNLDVPHCLDVSGRILIGGKATVGGIWMDNYGSAHASMVEVLGGAKLTVTNQLATYFDVAAFPKTTQVLRTNAGGEIEFTGGEFVNTAACEHHVFGTMKFGIPVSTTADLAFYGQGSVFMKSVKSSGVASRVVLGERVKLYPESWQTVAADDAAPVTFALRSWATLGATNDWTYGVAPGVTTATAAADRAITVPECETLWVDTQSPFDGLGYTVTFADPIVAPGGCLVKKGAGTLVLASADNDLATSEVTVEGGTLTWTVPQTFGKFAVKPGANLLIDVKDGALLTLELGEQDFDAEGVGVTLSEDAQDVAGLDWTTLATVGEGHVITGVPVLHEDWKTRIVALDAGGQALQCKKRGGAMLIIR